MIDIIKNTLASGEGVLISGFGKLCVKEKEERKNRNPATGENLMQPTRHVVTFKCSGKLRDRINDTPYELKAFKGNHVKLSVDNGGLGIAAATDLAKKKANEMSDDPMLLSWYCGKTGEYYPKTECGRTDKPPWIIFAESRGADIAININDGDYIFLYISL